MRSFSQLGSILKRLLPIVVVLSAIPGNLLLVCAQEGAQNTATVLAPQPAHAIPRLQPTSEQIGDAMLARRRYHEAMEAYKKVRTPSPDVWNKLGVSYQMLLDLKDAMRCYKESLRLSPANARTLNNLGSVYESLGDRPKAERQFRQALEVDPSMAVAAMNLGSNLIVQNKRREGLEMYQRAAALDASILDGIGATVAAAPVRPDQEGAVNYYKARCFARTGNTGRAIKYLRRAIDEGFASPEMIARDSSFDKLREGLAFNRLLADSLEH